MVHALIVATCHRSINGFPVFIPIGTRRIWVSPCTAHPTVDRTSQQARNFAMHVDEHNPPCNRVMRDNDKQYPKTFDDVFTTPTDKVKRNVPASPNLQSHVKRLVQTFKHEGNAPFRDTPRPIFSRTRGVPPNVAA